MIYFCTVVSCWTLKYSFEFFSAVICSVVNHAKFKLMTQSLGRVESGVYPKY